MARNNLNQVSLSGNLTADAELKYTNNGTIITIFTLAVNRTWDGKETASFFDVKLFGKLGEAIHAWLRKGKPVIVGGRLQQERWEQDGQNRSKVVVVADFVELLSQGQGQSQGQGYSPSTGPARNTAPAPRRDGPSEFYSKPVGPEDFASDRIDDDRIPF